MRLHQRNQYQQEHQRKLNRAAKKVLTADNVPDEYSHLTERVVTLPPQRGDDVPRSKWQQSPVIDEEITVCRAHNDSEMSREEQILDMLKKVERQKRLLLQEFGASLPEDIFNVSIRPLLENREHRELPRAAPRVAEAAKPDSPEIKVINMSSSEECAEKSRRGRKTSLDKSPTRKTEIAVQAALDKVSHAENKAVQVELPEENNVNTVRSTSETTRVPHPIEPKITVITPETDDSSNDSSNSDISGMLIEIDKKEVIVTPKKRKSDTKVSRRPSPRVYQKIRPTSVSSKATSPIKRYSRSSFRLGSPQKRTKCTQVDGDTASKRIDIRVSRSAFNDETEPLQETRVSIDASAESSQTISGTNNQDTSAGKPYKIRTQMKRWIRIKDTSDTTSTSFASPPPVKPRSVFDALTNVTPILEMLDISAPEELRRLRQEVSPVSTPETPSPRTMMMPSNIPHRDRITRMLRYNSIDTQTNDSTVVSSAQNDQADRSFTCQPEPAVEYPATPLQPSIPSRVCTCKNPTCKLLHTRLDDIHDYALKNCPEILQKYEDLQNLCTERIASLTDLIEKVRSEQKGKD